jgi:hypothetical protein
MDTLTGGIDSDRRLIYRVKRVVRYRASAVLDGARPKRNALRASSRDVVEVTALHQSLTSLHANASNAQRPERTANNIDACSSNRGRIRRIDEHAIALTFRARSDKVQICGRVKSEEACSIRREARRIVSRSLDIANGVHTVIDEAVIEAIRRAADVFTPIGHALEAVREPAARHERGTSSERQVAGQERPAVAPRDFADIRCILDVDAVCAVDLQKIGRNALMSAAINTGGEAENQVIAQIDIVPRYRNAYASKSSNCRRRRRRRCKRQ